MWRIRFAGIWPRGRWGRDGQPVQLRTQWGALRGPGLRQGLTQRLHDHGGDHLLQDFTVSMQRGVRVHLQQPHLGRHGSAPFPTHHLASKRLGPWLCSARDPGGSPLFYGLTPHICPGDWRSQGLRVWPEERSLLDTPPAGLGVVSLLSLPPPRGHTYGVRACTEVPASLHLQTRPSRPSTPQQYLEVLIDQEVTPDEVEVTQLALELGLDSQEAVGHDLLHPRLRAEQGRVTGRHLGA